MLKVAVCNERLIGGSDHRSQPWFVLTLAAVPRRASGEDAMFMPVAVLGTAVVV
jgi:hypothetical protein